MLSVSHVEGQKEEAHEHPNARYSTHGDEEYEADSYVNIFDGNNYFWSVIQWDLATCSSRSEKAYIREYRF